MHSMLIVHTPNHKMFLRLSKTSLPINAQQVGVCDKEK